MPEHSILKRTVLMEKTREAPYRPADFCLVVTTLGNAVEPFTSYFGRSSGGTFDPTEDCTRIDEIILIDLSEEKLRLSGGEHALIGGVLTPRIGR